MLSKKGCKHSSQHLKEELNEVDARLRVKTSMDSIVFHWTNNFVLTSNYHKGNVNALKSRMEERHLDNLLCHAPNNKVKLQDVVYARAGPAHSNRPLYMEWSCKRLRAHEKVNMLEQNTHMVLSSQATAAMFRLFVTIETSLVMPMQWFAGN